MCTHARTPTNIGDPNVKGEIGFGNGMLYSLVGFAMLKVISYAILLPCTAKAHRACEHMGSTEINWEAGSFSSLLLCALGNNTLTVSHFSPLMRIWQPARTLATCSGPCHKFSPCFGGCKCSYRDCSRMHRVRGGGGAPLSRKKTSWGAKLMPLSWYWSSLINAPMIWCEVEGSLTELGVLRGRERSCWKEKKYAVSLWDEFHWSVAP